MGPSVHDQWQWVKRGTATRSVDSCFGDFPHKIYTRIRDLTLTFFALDLSRVNDLRTSKFAFNVRRVCSSLLTVLIGEFICHQKLQN